MMIHLCKAYKFISLQGDNVKRISNIETDEFSKH